MLSNLTLIDIEKKLSNKFKACELVSDLRLTYQDFCILERSYKEMLGKFDDINFLVSSIKFFEATTTTILVYEALYKYRKNFWDNIIGLLNIESKDVNLIKDTFESISIKAERKNIKFSIKKGYESPIAVNADKEKIRQVILNLFENSIKYGKNNGSIVAGIYKTDNKRILIEISDDGIGIDEKSIPRIFERFYRTQAGRSIDVTGSGLGLAICKHIIEAHNQTIHIRSTENVGTTIGFTLTARKE